MEYIKKKILPEAFGPSWGCAAAVLEVSFTEQTLSQGLQQFCLI